MTVLEDLNVVEFGASSVAGSLMGMLLADNGARVVKVEPPGGDRIRDGWPSGWLVWNRGKESRVLDLRTDAGRAEALQFAEAADVIIEGFGAGTAERYGVDYDVVSRANPGVVYCSIKGFGSTGPYAHIVAYEHIVGAKTGFFMPAIEIATPGWRDGPIFEFAPMASTGAALLGMSGVLAALIARDQTGRGQRLESTLMQGLTPYNYNTLAIRQDLMRRGAEPANSLDGVAPGAVNVRYTRHTFSICSSDGHWLKTQNLLPHQSQGFIRALGLAHILEDPCYADAPDFATYDDAEAYSNLIWETFRSKTKAEWWPRILAEPDVAAEFAVSSEAGLDHPQLLVNGNVIEVHDPVHGSIREVGALASFSKTPSKIERSAPALDAHHGPFVTTARSPRSGPLPKHPLDGITIVELGYFYALPFGDAIAASLGARVIKLEPLQGDPWRLAGATKDLFAAKPMEGKESIAVDLRTPEGIAIAQEIIQHADVFTCGFRPAAAGRLGLDYATLVKSNPKLVYIQAAGYGNEGPFADRPTYALPASTITGSDHRHSAFWMDPAHTNEFGVLELQLIAGPRMIGQVPGDANAAMIVSIAMLMGLLDQRRTGEGQYVVTTMVGSGAFGYADDFCLYEGKQPLPSTNEDQTGLHSLYRCYQASTGWVFLAVTRQSEWERLTEVLASPELADLSFSTESDRQVNDEALGRLLERIFRSRSAGEWEKLLVERHVACVEAWAGTVAEFSLSDPYVREAGFIVEVEHPTLGKMMRHGPPVMFSETPARIAPGPVLGQHTDALLRELGHGPDHIAALRARRVVA
jgi:crotonobetainyl-CoA:carnitine CoA-transferase CaiB-like acyl-CoA transferase